MCFYMLTFGGHFALHKATPALTPALPNVANLVSPRAWRRVVSLDSEARSVDWYVAPAPLVRALPPQAHCYSLRQVLDKGFFFPLAPVSPFAQLPARQSVNAPVLANKNPRTFRGQTAKIRRPLKKKKATLGVVPAFWSFSAPLPVTKKSPTRKRRYLARAQQRRARRPSQPIRGWGARPATRLYGRPTTLPALPLIVDAVPTQLKRLYFIPQTRFKPGFKAHWRLLRFDYARTIGIRATRQTRITRYVASIRALRGFTFITTLTMTAGFILRQANLSQFYPLGYTLRAALQRVFEGGWALNFKPLTNLYIQTYPGDLLSQYGAIKFNDTRPKHAFWAQSSRLRHENLLNVFAARATTATPWFLEVDELTRTVGVLAAPRALSEIDPALWHAYPFLTHRMLNWKYRY